MSDPRRPLRLPAIVLCLAVLSLGCGRADREDKAFAKLSNDFFEFYFENNPVSATAAGDHRYDDRMNDMSLDGRKRILDIQRDYLERLRRIDTGKLSAASRVDAQYLEENIEMFLLYDDDLRALETNPTLYVELLANSVFYVLSREFAPLDKRLDLIARRLEQFPRVVEEARMNLANPPKLLTEIAIEETAGTISYLEHELRHEAEAYPAQREKIERALGPALESLRAYREFLEKDLINRSFGDIRLGERIYRDALRLTLGTDMPSEEIVALAYEDLDRVHDRMYTLAAPMYEEMTGAKIPGAPDAREKKEIIRKVLDRIADDHPNPPELLDACKGAYAEAASFVREKNIVALPEEPFEIIWALPFHQAGQIAASILPGPLDRDMKYLFIVSPGPASMDARQAEMYMREYNTEMIRVVTIHEAMPGHYVQFAYGNRHPSIVRSVFPNAAFAEGWAVYCQDMMWDEGFRADDPAFKLMSDKYYLRVVINAILDSGMHRENMQENEAVRLVTEEGFQDEAEALTKWRRRIGYLPCYTSSYFTGSREVWNLRREAEDRWGARFTLADFHQKLLGQGTIPVRYVRELIFQE